jgi:hypothetical protein
MVDPQGATFYPVISGLKPGERVVTSGSFLVDAETRLNPAAGSIYFGNSGSKQSSSASNVNVRPSTPEDPAANTATNPAAPDVSEADIQAALAKLPPDTRAEAEKQRLCPITGNRLGVMGPPIQLTIENQPVWLCCEGCKEEAIKDPKATLSKVAELKQAK